jgi:hypothetical protein
MFPYGFWEIFAKKKNSTLGMQFQVRYTERTGEVVLQQKRLLGEHLEGARLWLPQRHKRRALGGTND